MGRTGDSGESRVLIFDRSPVSRIISCSAVFASAAFLFDYLSKDRAEIRILPLTALVLLVIGTVFSALLQYGDHIYLSDDGVMYRNRFFPRFGKHSHWMRWDEVVEVREMKKKILVLFSADGRRVLVDAIGGYAIARAEVLRRTPQAVRSGTLERSEDTAN